MKKIKRLGPGTTLEIEDTRHRRISRLFPGAISIGGPDLKRSRSGIIQWTPKWTEDGVVVGSFVYFSRGIWRLCQPLLGIDAPLIAGGAFPPTSCLPGVPWQNSLGTTGPHFNLSSTTQKFPMFTNAITTPNMNDTAANWCYGTGSWLTGNEISGSPYVAGGPNVPGPSVLNDAGTIRYTFGDIILASAVISGIHGGVICDSAAVVGGHAAIHTLFNFGDDFSVDGTDFIISPSDEGAWFWPVNNG